MLQYKGQTKKEIYIYIYERKNAIIMRENSSCRYPSCSSLFKHNLKAYSINCQLLAQRVRGCTEAKMQEKPKLNLSCVISVDVHPIVSCRSLELGVETWKWIKCWAPK